MRLAIRRAVMHVTEAFIAVHGETVRDSDGKPMFADSETTSRLMNRPTTHERAMYQSVAIAKIDDVLLSIRHYVRDRIGPEAWAIVEKAVEAAELARAAEIERLQIEGPTGFVIDQDGDVAMIDDSGEVKQRS